MAFVLIPEDGSGVANANSYAALADATAYNQASANGAAWGELSDDAKGVLLARATRTIDSLCTFPGYPVKAAQALRWPRQGVVVDGWPLDPAKLPSPLVWAVCELGGVLATNGGVDVTAASDTDALEKLTVGPIELDFRATGDGLTQEQKTREYLPSTVYALLLPLLGSTPLAPIRLVRA